MKLSYYINSKNNKRPYYIGEIANSHAGKMNLLKKSVIELNKTKVDSIKFQFFWASDLVKPKHKMYKVFKKLEFKKEEWINFFSFLDKNNTKDILFDVFGMDSFKFLVNNCKKISGFKIHTSDIYNFDLIKRVSLERKPILLSCGGLLHSEIVKAKKYINKFNDNKIILMNGFQSYPTIYSDLRLNERFSVQKKLKNVIIGYADHTSSDLDECYIIPFLFLEKGVRIIEKHFTLNRSLKLNDYHSSIERKEFVKFINIGNLLYNNMIKLNDKRINFSKNETNYREQVIKIVHAKCKIYKGQIIKKADLCLLRPVNTNNKQLRKMKDVIGKKALKNIKQESTLNSSDVG